MGDQDKTYTYRGLKQSAFECRYLVVVIDIYTTFITLANKIFWQQQKNIGVKYIYLLIFIISYRLTRPYPFVVKILLFCLCCNIYNVNEFLHLFPLLKLQYSQ